MNRDEFFATAAALPFADLAKLLGRGGAVVVAPHPDDESLGCGALISEAAAAGRSVRIIVLSDGTRSHPNSKAFPREKLRALREEEARRAASALGVGVSQITFVGLPDGRVPVAGADAGRASAAIVRAIEQAGAEALFVTWRHDQHSDHQAAYAIARSAQHSLAGIRLFEYSIWGRGVPFGTDLDGPPRGWRFASSRHRDRKRAAILCHRSQTSNLIGDDPEGFILPPGMVEDILARDEVFLEMDP
jgi:LmbE family N-acetylglucosaminyl deacetylase